MTSYALILTVVVVDPRRLALNREIKTRVYGKRQMSDSRLRFVKINNKYTRMMQNNSHVYGQHKTTYDFLETANEEKSWSRGHFCRFPFALNASLNLSIAS